MYVYEEYGWVSHGADCISKETKCLCGFTESGDLMEEG